VLAKVFIKPSELEEQAEKEREKNKSRNNFFQSISQQLFRVDKLNGQQTTNSRRN